jgi:hypothetical protein
MDVVAAAGEARQAASAGPGCISGSCCCTGGTTPRPCW